MVLMLHERWGDSTCGDLNRLLEKKPRQLGEASPGDVKKQKAKRLKELRERIKQYEGFIADAEAEIEAWKNL
jgi:hypothetical protein